MFLTTRKWSRFLFCALVSIFPAIPAFSQTATLHGSVTDQTGAIVPGAVVTLTDATGTSHSGTSDASGNYSIGGLTPGSYTLNASAPDLALAQPVQLEIKSGTQPFDVTLLVQAAVQKLSVEAEGTPLVSTEAGNNASATVLRGADRSEERRVGKE